MSRTPIRVLFVAEAVTLAHMARPAVLAAALPGDRYQYVFAASDRYLSLFPELALRHRPLWSISSGDFLNKLSKGKALYSREILTRYVEADLELIDAVLPDLIIGDFRLSLSISARLRQIPYGTVSNAYWTPYATGKVPVPTLPLTRALGPRLGQHLFDLARPAAFALHCRPLNAVRRHFGLPPLGHDLRSVYSDGDQVLVADMAEYFPLPNPPEHVHHIGPLTWAPSSALPDWWHDLDSSQPVVYVNLGSSGPAELLPRILEGLADMPVSVIAATAGQTGLQSVPSNVRVSEYLPGDIATETADLVICNGGSLTTYQAIVTGTPVLGICTNLDQHLNMGYLARAGIGSSLRSETLGPKQLRETCSKLLTDPTVKEAMRSAKTHAAAYDVSANFLAALTRLVG